MAVSTRMLRRNLPNAPQAAGGTVGVGAPVLLREVADVRNGQAVTLLGEPNDLLGRLTTPSVAWGLGVGSLTGALWWMDAGGRALQDFYLAHTATSIPTSVVSALLPKAPAAGAAEQTFLQRRLTQSRSATNGSGGSSATDEFAPAGGTSGAAQ